MSKVPRQQTRELGARKFAQMIRIGLGVDVIITIRRADDDDIHARLLDGVEGIAQVKFTAEDVIRHELVARIVAAYEGSPKPAAVKP